MDEGVTIVDPNTTYIDSSVQIARDATIHPFTFLEGNTSIGEGAEIGPQVRIVDSEIAEGSHDLVRRRSRIEHRARGFGRALRLAAAGNEARARGAAGLLRRIQADDTRRGEQGQSPRLSRGCPDRSRGQRGGRNHHLQLGRDRQARRRSSRTRPTSDRTRCWSLPPGWASERRRGPGRWCEEMCPTRLSPSAFRRGSSRGRETKCGPRDGEDDEEPRQ